ncbi:MAG: hypothetical protein AAF899_00820 [Pseudomonadota bacterium]
MILRTAGAALVVSAIAVLATGVDAVAEACPSIARDSTRVLEQPRDLDRPVRLEVRLAASGPIDLSACRAVPRDSVGIVGEMPAVTVRIHRHDAHDIAISAGAPCDTVLLTNDASGGWIFDDDGGGNLDPALLVERPLEGAHDIWLGGYDAPGCDAVLTVELLPRGPGG